MFLKTANVIAKIIRHHIIIFSALVIEYFPYATYSLAWYINPPANKGINENIKILADNAPVKSNDNRHIHIRLMPQPGQYRPVIR